MNLEETSARCLRPSILLTLIGVSIACGPRADGEPEGMGTGSATTDAATTGTTTLPAGSSGASGTGGDAEDDSGETGSSSTTSDVEQSCVELAQMQWSKSESLGGQTCGDMTIAGRSDDGTALLVLSVPPILGSPWDDQWEAHALYSLPERGVVAQIARYAEPLPPDAEVCREGGALPDGAIEAYDLQAELDFYLLNRDEVGCIFTCDTVYAELQQAAIDCGGEMIPLGAPEDPNAGTVQLRGFAELP